MGTERVERFMWQQNWNEITTRTLPMARRHFTCVVNTVSVKCKVH